MDTEIEKSLSKVETHLPKLFRAFDEGAQGEFTRLSPFLFDMLTRYCAMLKRCSLFSKASAVVSVVEQLNHELSFGRYDLWHSLGTPLAQIELFRQQHASGRRIVISGENVMQLLYRFQFERLINLDCSEFSQCEWALLKSPVELAVSDIGLIHFYNQAEHAKHFLLPIGPRLLLEGWLALNKEFSATPSGDIPTFGMTLAQARPRLEIIVGSAINEIVASEEIPNIEELLASAKQNGPIFTKVVNLPEVSTVGRASSSRRFGLSVVSMSEYKDFIQTYLLAGNVQHQ